MHEDKFRSLANNYIQNRCTESEVKLFFKYISKGNYDNVFKEEMDKVDFNPALGYVGANFKVFENIFLRIKRTISKG